MEAMTKRRGEIGADELEKEPGALGGGVQGHSETDRGDRELKGEDEGHRPGSQARDAREGGR